MVTFTHENVDEYAKAELTGEYLFAAKVIEEKIKPFKDKIKCIVDYGCGAGKSTRVTAQAVNPSTLVVGIDISPEMVERAEKITAERVGELPSVLFEYHTLKNGKIPLEDSFVDCVVSTLVFQELHTEDRLNHTISEIARIAKKDAPVIIIFPSDKITCEEFCSFSYAPYPENKDPSSSFRKCISESGTMTWDKDKHWTKDELTKAFTQAGFKNISAEYPLADTSFPPYPNDPSIPWKAELHISPFLVMSAEKV
jgi:ubiquinone/menaquinone biosynthesis C-methylase UbiE